MLRIDYQFFRIMSDDKQYIHELIYESTRYNSDQLCFMRVRIDTVLIMGRGEGGNEVRLVFADLSEPSFVLFTANEMMSISSLI